MLGTATSSGTMSHEMLVDEGLCAQAWSVCCDKLGNDLHRTLSSMRMGSADLLATHDDLSRVERAELLTCLLPSPPSWYDLDEFD